MVGAVLSGGGLEINDKEETPFRREEAQVSDLLREQLPFAAVDAS